jgi:hypothetical protein
MPPNTVYVGRPTQWGNPYNVDDWTIHMALAAYEDWLDNDQLKDPNYLSKLRGKNLACWCKLNEPCHADILIKKLKERYGTEIADPLLPQLKQGVSEGAD